MYQLQHASFGLRALMGVGRAYSRFGPMCVATQARPLWCDDELAALSVEGRGPLIVGLSKTITQRETSSKDNVGHVHRGGGRSGAVGLLLFVFAPPAVRGLH